MKKPFLCVTAVLSMHFYAPGLRAEDADVSRILRFAYSRTNSVVEIVNPDKDKRPPKQIPPTAPNPVETIEVPRKGSLTVAFDDHNPFLFDLASATELTDSAGLAAFRALLTDLASGTKALVKSTGGVAIQSASGSDTKCEHKSTDFFYGYKLYIEGVDLWTLLENLKGLADFTSRENEYAASFTFDRGRFMDMVKDLDLTKVRKQVAYIENLAKNQPEFFTYQYPLKQDVVLTIEDMDTGLKYRFMLVDFLAGASGRQLGYLEPQGAISTKTPTNGTATIDPPPPLAPTNNQTSTTEIAKGNVSQQGAAKDERTEVQKKKDKDEDTQKALDMAGLECIQNHFHASLAHSVRFFTDKLSPERMEKLAQHGRVLAGRVETARSAKPLLPKPQVYEWDYRKAADLSLRISPVPVDSYPEELKKIQKDLSRDYIFHAEPKQRVIYAVSAAAAYSFVTDYDAKRTDSGKVSVTEKDATGINGAIMLNIYNPDWYDDLFEPFFQVGVLPDSDDYGLFLGTGFSADKGRYSVGLGVAYQRVDRLRPGISAGQSVAAGVPLTDKEFEAGLYIQVGLSLGKP